MKSRASEPGLTNHLYAQQLDYVNLIAVRKYHFLESFFVLCCVQSLCCNDSKISFLKLKGRFGHEC